MNNTSNHQEEDGSTATLAVSGAITGLATICVALRFFVRIRMKINIAWDDWFILIALLVTLLEGGLILAGNGIDPTGDRFSQEAANNPNGNFDFGPHQAYLKLTYPVSSLYFLIMSSIKTSCLLLYRRVFSVDIGFRRQFYAMMVIVWLFWVSCTIATILNCLPFEYNWISIGDPKHCFNYNIFWMISGAIEVFLDAVILALPVPLVLKLQLRKKRKVLVLLIFLLGCFVIITGTIRVIYGYVPGSILPSYSKSEIWSTVHVGTGIACACLPPLRPLFFRSSASKRSKGTSSLRRRYYGIQDWQAKGVGPGSSGVSGGSKTRDTIEEIPLRSQQAEPSRVKTPRSETTWLPEDPTSRAEQGDMEHSSRENISRVETEWMPEERRETV
ncbi:hypothetical protein MMC30_009123 [Trapelia coarctata]|nr:hypothetical protein [Trapelia coarctata]